MTRATQQREELTIPAPFTEAQKDEPVDLNKVGIPGSPFPPNDNSASTEQIDVFFKDLQKHLIAAIDQADAVVGCVYLLNSKEILNKLSQKAECCIVVGKDQLHGEYGGLKGVCIWHFGSSITAALLPSMRQVGRIEGVRCIDYPNGPLLHNKFLVFCRRVVDEGGTMLYPYAVWTGSYNFTYSASNHLENAVIIREPRIVDAFFDEWDSILAISEPLKRPPNSQGPEWRYDEDAG